MRQPLTRWRPARISSKLQAQPISPAASVELDVEWVVRVGVWGKDGMGNVHVQRVWLDDQEIPRFALEFFLEHYLKPRVPQASLDSRFRMPARIQTAIVATGKTTLYQK